MSRHTIIRLALTLSLLLPLAAQAHTGSGHAAGFGSGFLHPFLGWDHLLAMVAVGIWAALLGGRVAWLLPFSFLLALLLGASLGAGMTLASALLLTAGFSLMHSLRHWRLERLAPYSGMTILAGSLLLALG